MDASTFPAADGSFAVSAGRSDPSLFTFTSLSSGPLGGSVLAVGTQTLGTCNYVAPTMDAVLTTSPSSPAAATWDLIVPPPLSVVVNVADVTHAVNP